MEVIEKIMTEDGRWAERRIFTEENGDKLVELWAEEPRDLKLENRVVEKHSTITVISERKTEKVNAEGEIYDVKIESINPKEDIRLVEHIGLATKENTSKFATKEELKEVVIAAISEVKSQQIAPFPNKNLGQLKAQSVIATRVEEDKTWTLLDKVLAGVCVIAAATIAYLLWM